MGYHWPRRIGGRTPGTPAGRWLRDGAVARSAVSELASASVGDLEEAPAEVSPQHSRSNYFPKPLGIEYFSVTRVHVHARLHLVVVLLQQNAAAEHTDAGLAGEPAHARAPPPTTTNRATTNRATTTVVPTASGRPPLLALHHDTPPGRLAQLYAVCATTPPMTLACKATRGCGGVERHRARIWASLAKTPQWRSVLGDRGSDCTGKWHSRELCVGRPAAAKAARSGSASVVCAAGRLRLAPEPPPSKLASRQPAVLARQVSADREN